jgi:hypothetical protein
MKLLILKSVPNHLLEEEYTVSMNTSFADRFMSHLRGECDACERNCTGCRTAYDLDFSETIAGVIRFPAILPAIIDEPLEFIPKDIPHHDILISIAVNEEILFSFLKRHTISKGVIVPIEESGWISPYGQRIITELCEQRKIEIDFPKPFCSFDPKEGILKEFKTLYRIGQPKLCIDLEKGVVVHAEVVSSAPCGATYFTAKGLTGKSVDEDLVFLIDKLLSSYPCTAGTDFDKEFQDSIIHQAVRIQRGVLSSIEKYLPAQALER